MQCAYVWRKLTQSKGYQKKVLIIRNDSIGDYIIFRNFLSELKKDNLFSEYAFHYLTSQKMLPIVSQLDGHLLNSITAHQQIDSMSSAKALTYFKNLNQHQFEYILHPTYSPDIEAHTLIKHINAKHKIGFDGDTSNQTLKIKYYFEPYYSQLIKVKDSFSHEFEKGKDFIQAVLNKPISIIKPQLAIDNTIEKKKQILVCPGAQHVSRIWPLSYYAQLIDLLEKSHSDYALIIATGPGEEKLYSEIRHASNSLFTHYKIEDIQSFIALISTSMLVLSNDSSAAHISVACNTNNICISNGNHFKRFVPYPKEMETLQITVLPDNLLSKTQTEQNQYYFGSDININEIQVDSVFKKVHALLQNHR